jgi:formylmethanofuran dehydrogenase subunit E
MRRLKMIHKLCDRCGEMESVDSMVRLDDNYYCTECDEEMEKEIEDDYKQLDV